MAKSEIWTVVELSFSDPATHATHPWYQSFVNRTTALKQVRKQIAEHKIFANSGESYLTSTRDVNDDQTIVQARIAPTGELDYEWIITKTQVQ